MFASLYARKWRVEKSNLTDESFTKTEDSLKMLIKRTRDLMMVKNIYIHDFAQHKEKMLTLM